MEVIGKGAQGEVCRRRTTEEERINGVPLFTAVKFSTIPSEAAILLYLKGADCVPDVFSVHSTPRGGTQIEMEWFPHTLDILSRNGTLGHIPSVMKSLLNVIHTMHTMGIYHFDLKPDNIIIRGHELRLIDFHLAMFHSQFQQTEPFRVQTVTHRAPEVVRARGFIDRKFNAAAVDMWSVGVIWLDLLCGTSSFRHCARQILSPSQRSLLWNQSTSQELATLQVHSVMRKQARRFHAYLGRAGLALLLSLLSPEPDQRPVAEETLRNPIFWDVETHLLFWISDSYAVGLILEYLS